MGAEIETLEQAFADFNEGDFKKAVSGFREDFEWVDAPELPGARTWRGREGVLACWASWTEVWGKVTMEPAEYLEVRDGVYLVSQTMRASGAASGTPIEMELWCVCYFRDGKPWRITYHVTEDSARQAAGLSPKPRTGD